MTVLRWQKRHVYQTMYDLTKQILTDTGWIGNNVPFGESSVTVVDRVPTTGTSTATNMVAVSFATQTSPVPIQMGPDSPMTVTYPFYLDVFGTSMSVAMSIGSDLAQWLQDPRNVSRLVTDYSAVPPVASDNRMEFDMVVGPFEPTESYGIADFRRYWQTIKGDLIVTY